MDRSGGDMHVMIVLTLILSYRSVLPASNFNGDLSKWDTSKVSTLETVSLMDGVDSDTRW